MNEERPFHYLARAVIRDGDRILLARLKGAGHTFLPGGHIEFGEGARAALVRELKEEIGMSAQVRRFAGAVEHTWVERGVRNAEINLLFEVDLPGLTAATTIQAASAAEAHLEFLWAEPANLAKHNLQPAPIVDWFRRGGGEILRQNPYIMAGRTTCCSSPRN